MFKVFFISLLFILYGCEEKREITKSDIYTYQNILNIKNIPKQAKDKNPSSFFDQGSWHSYALFPDLEKKYFGGFIGPFLMNEWRWLSPQLIKLILINAETDEEINLSEAKLLENVYLPGKLVQTLALNDLEITLTLIFLNDKSTLINSVITNNGTNEVNLIIGYTGSIFYENANFKKGTDHIRINTKGSENLSSIHLKDFNQTTLKLDSMTYRLEYNKPTNLSSGRSFETNIIQSRFDDSEQFKKTDFRVRFARLPTYFEENRTRWFSYLKPILESDSKWAREEKYRKVAVKSVLTLINNWKGPRGALKYGGLIPSYNIHYFNGFWAWDSWKHSAALSYFNPSLAKEQIKAMFIRQNNEGMIPDCIFANPEEDNWRDTKPPLSAWAVFKIMENNQDLDFLNYMYSKLKKYHQWWYEDRDHDHNGLCEYGSTDGTEIAAKWESGMDNAIRFDQIKMVKNSKTAYSMNLESVDLNAYLFAEKMYLAKLAKMLKEFDEAKQFEQEADDLKSKINTSFYDKEKGYFFDKRLEKDSLISDAGPEGWIPLWSQSASEENAKYAFQYMSNPNTFSTFIPFPTVSKSNPGFSLGYWRGTVWLDQVYFAIQGLRNYGYNTEADQYTKQIFDRLEGITDSDLPIMENYNPENGERLNVNHFSWSAAHLLLLYLEK